MTQEKALQALHDENERLGLYKDAYAQLEQEPHSWYSKQEDEWMTHKIRMEHERLNSYTHKVGKFDLALYTTPPQRTWVGLTDEDVRQCSRDVAAGGKENCVDRFAYAIESKLKEKNT